MSSNIGYVNREMLSNPSTDQEETGQIAEAIAHSHFKAGERG
jgi:hypothetical protein